MYFIKDIYITVCIYTVMIACVIMSSADQSRITPNDVKFNDKLHTYQKQSLLFSQFSQLATEEEKAHSSVEKNSVNVIHAAVNGKDIAESPSKENKKEKDCFGSYKQQESCPNKCACKNDTFCSKANLQLDIGCPEKYVYTDDDAQCIDKDECSSMYICDCNNLNLTCVPSDLPANIAGLKLSNNSITRLSEYAFDKYKELKVLFLNQNYISNLNRLTFCSLSKLLYLDISDNNLTMTKGTFPTGVFKPMASLCTLKMNKNNNSETRHVTYRYPDEALSDLTQLRKLFMDGLTNQPLGDKFQEMKNLVSLHMTGFVDGFCQLGSVNRSTFVNVPGLVVLNISNCKLKEIDPETFEPLVNLTVLDIHYNEDLGIQNLAAITQSLRNSSLKFLDASTIESRYSIGQTVNTSHIQNLPASLLTLKVAGNNIETILPGMFKMLPPNLCNLDVGKNKFVFGAYLQNLTELQELKILTISGEDYLYDIPTAFPTSRSQFEFRHYKKSRSVHYWTSQFTFPIPPKLEKLELYNAGLNYRLTTIVLNPNNSLTHLNLDRNYFPVLVGPLKGFDRLINLNISKSFVSKIKPTFFENLKQLLELNMKENLLGDYFNTIEESLFQNLTNLLKLDLSFNAISNLPDNLFKGLYNLTKLNLSRNKISTLTNVSFDDLMRLQHLNLSSNSLHSLPTQVTQHITQLHDQCTSTSCITIDLSNNPIDCSCSNLDFLEWMVNYDCFFTFKNYLCLQDDGSILTLEGDYKDEVMRLRKECASNKVLFLIIIGITLILVVIIIIILAHRFRWKLRYLYYAAIVNYQRNKGDVSDKEFEYDVFISYVHTDETFVVQTLSPELEKRGVKVYMHGLKFVAGNYITSNIVNAVKECRKTLVVLSSKMLKSHWCNYEVQMANMEAVYSGRQVLVFLFKEKVPKHKLGTLLSFIDSNTYIEYPQGEGLGEWGLKTFYDKLASDLR